MNRNILLAIFLLITATACTVYKEYPIDIYKPGEISIPSDAKNVALIYRNFKYPGDTLQYFYKDNYQLKRARTNENLDSILVKACLTELAKNFKEKNTFNEVKILPYDLFKRHTSKKLPPLNFGLIKKITSSTHSDLLISLETYSYFFSEYPQNYDNPPSNEVITASVWAVYDPVADRLIERKALIDTVYWNGYDDKGNYQRGYKLPPREAALKIASQLAGENYAKRFFASWQTVNRTYSIPPLPDFSDAANFIDQGKWDDAIRLWKNYASDKNGKLAINARYNLALAYEMKDDFVMASRWLEAAQNLAVQYRSKDDLKMILAYRKILQKRINDIKKLNQK
jgi:signal peptidase I